MTFGLPLAVLACLANACTYVGLLYIWRGSLPRDHPTTIKRRLLSTGMACAVCWLPVYVWSSHTHGPSTPVLSLLGLRLPGLTRALIDSLYLCVTLFAGPLMFFLHTLGQQVPQQPPPAPARPAHTPAPPATQPTTGTTPQPPASEQQLRRRAGASSGSETTTTDTITPVAGSADGFGAEDASPGRGHNAEAAAVDGNGCCRGAGGAGGSGGRAGGWLAGWLGGCCGDLRQWRNLVAAPLSEEFVFRACMAPLLMLEGLSSRRVVLLTPLFFGAAHLHHAAELVRHQGMSVRRAAAMVGFQLAYTTVFGWLATYLFLRTGHLAAPVAAHAFCNWAGFPPFADMAAHPRAPMLLLTTVAGAATFALALPRMTAPERYQQDFYGGW